MPATNRRRSTPPAATDGSRRSLRACSGLGASGAAAAAWISGRCRTTGAAADRMRSGRSCGTLRAGVLRARPSASEVVAACTTGRTVSDRTAGAGPTGATARAAATTGAREAIWCPRATAGVDATRVDTAPERCVGSPTWNGVGAATGPSSAARPALSPPAWATVGVLEDVIVTPACGAACRTGVSDGSAPRSGDATSGLAEDGAVAAAETAGAVPVTAGVTGAGVGVTAGDGAGGAGVRTAAGAGAGPGAGAGSGVGGGAGAGAGAARGGSSPRGSTYPSSSAARRIPRWTLGTSCSGVPLAPMAPTASPSPTVAPFPTSIVPRWTSVTA
jgi:hypothetical protein